MNNSQIEIYFGLFNVNFICQTISLLQRNLTFILSTCMLIKENSIHVHSCEYYIAMFFIGDEQIAMPK